MSAKRTGVPRVREELIRPKLYILTREKLYEKELNERISKSKSAPCSHQALIGLKTGSKLSTTSRLLPTPTLKVLILHYRIVFCD